MPAKLAVAAVLVAAGATKASVLMYLPPVLYGEGCGTRILLDAPPNPSFHQCVSSEAERTRLADEAATGPTSVKEAERVLFELARFFTREAQRTGGRIDLMTANVLLALREARRAPTLDALEELEKGARKLVHGGWNKGFATTRTAKTATKEHLISVFAEAIAYWLPRPEGGTRQVHPWARGRTLRDIVVHEDGSSRVRPSAMPPPGFHRWSPETKMALYIDHFGICRHRWKGILPPLPKNRVEVLEKVIGREILHGRLRGPHNARTLCMKFLAALGMTKAERDAFIGFLKMRTKRA
jgi:hypothetical protein